MTTNQAKLTRQGVLDLDAKYGRVQTRKREELPKSQFCKHPNRYKIIGGDTFCPDCNALFAWEDGKEY